MIRIRHYQGAGPGVLRYAVSRTPVHQPRGTLLLLQGRAEYLEKYTEVMAEASRFGWDVFSPEWRGQGKSARCLPDLRKGHIEDFSRYENDLRIFMTHLENEAPGPVWVLAHSMGAHIALRFFREACNMPVSGLIMTAPMLGIRTRPFPAPLARHIIDREMKSGNAGMWAPRQGPWRIRSFAGNPLTGDRKRWMREQRFLRRHPEAALGGVTVGWLSAAFRSMDRLACPGFVSGLHLPVLLFSAGRDRVVQYAPQQCLARHLPSCRHIILPGARHELLMETDPVRQEIWHHIMEFTQDVF